LSSFVFFQFNREPVQTGQLGSIATRQLRKIIVDSGALRFRRLPYDQDRTNKIAFADHQRSGNKGNCRYVAP
jgi:hypothetical protein